MHELKNHNALSNYRKLWISIIPLYKLPNKTTLKIFLLYCSCNFKQSAIFDFCKLIGFFFNCKMILNKEFKIESIIPDKKPQNIE